MRNLIKGGLVAAALFFALPGLAADERDVTFVNATGYGIKFIGVNEPGDEDFSDNELSAVLADGNSVFIKFNEADEGCKWNIKIDWSMEGYPSPLLRNVDLCKVTTITLTYDKATAVTSYTTR